MDKDSPRENVEKKVLAFQKGEKIEFPVPRGHRYACFQTVTPIAADDVVIPAGTIVVLNNPLTHLKFAHVDLKGDLVCRGDLVIERTH